MTIRKHILVSCIFCAGLICGGVLFAQRPVENIDPGKHSNLAAAQKHLIEAWNATDQAQRANKDELGGHADKAKEHMQAADAELKAAAEYADHHH
ncbi:MAG TPA: hypothetical protein VMU53_04750 [Candidatus Sulfotelmatobacter sp.]|nr:hypothetical protein [Candidatus Sulfotelmatobacter sp.]